MAASATGTLANVIQAEAGDALRPALSSGPQATRQRSQVRESQRDGEKGPWANMAASSWPSAQRDREAISGHPGPGDLESSLQPDLQ